MKWHLFTLTVLPVLAFSSAVFAAPQPESCLTKQQEIQTQLDYAYQHNNKNQISGLQKALSENKAHCTDAGLKAENARHVAEKKHKVKQREYELKEAQTKGDNNKIAQKQKKLDQAKSELQEAQGQ
ncbi:DUF1090 domain-containing protein [Hafnia psychrotolerans]|uniref:DUF1090 domain-containing protein n=1 Tax=Hafnia psychrotolerans TaxID=1477018 RepID=A0ABQ1H8K9_9GAMM|nr:DUF1090 domain-containing protein [Hafnia psychrotolerans]GGA61437.1 hypothetical protein GCM10011328_41060 [Hafnia psychrotolerans]